MGGGVKRRQAQSLAELAVGVVCPQACPVVVGAVVEIFVLVAAQGIPHVHKAASGGLYGAGKLVEIRFLMEERSARGDVLRVDHGGRRHQHHVDLARIALAEGFQGGGVLGQGAGFAGEQAVSAGEHLVFFAQQDAAVLGLLEEGCLHKALQADPLVPAKHLIFDILGVAGKVIVQPVCRGSGELGPLGEGGVFQLAVGAVRCDEIQHEQPKEEQPERQQHRVLPQGGAFFVVFFHQKCLPFRS